jgi:hypothetical protein
MNLKCNCVFADKTKKYSSGGTNLSESNGRKLFENEIKDIEESMETTALYLGKESVKKEFKSFQEVMNELKSAISNKGEARAVKNVCIYTPIKASNEDIEFIFYDVPGYDSPFTLHKEQTKAKIASVDALLFATEFRKPDLTDSETQMLEISDQKNPQIKTKDKIIVACTQSDKANSAHEYRTLITHNQTSWGQFDVPRDRVIPVCALAELNTNTEESQNAKDILKKLNSTGNTGFLELKNAVKLCVENSRNAVAETHCNELKNSLKIMVNRVMQLVKNDFNIDSKTEIKYKEFNDFEKNSINVAWWTQVILIDFSKIKNILIFYLGMEKNKN